MFRASRSIVGLTARDRVHNSASMSFDTAAEEFSPAPGRPWCCADDGRFGVRLSGSLPPVEPDVLDLPTAYWHES